MFQRERSPKQDFRPDEELYYRYKDDGVGINEDEGTLEQRAEAYLSENFRLPDQSVNRGRFSSPVDVLFPDWCTEGVLAFCVRAIPRSVGAGQHKFEFFPKHDPHRDNYGHSIIVVRKNGKVVAHNDQKRIKPKARKEVREAVAQHATIRVPPSRGKLPVLVWFRRRFLKEP